MKRYLPVFALLLLISNSALAEWSASLMSGISGDNGKSDSDFLIAPLIEYQGERFSANTFQLTYHAIKSEKSPLDVSLLIDPEPLLKDFELQPYGSLEQNYRYGLLGFKAKSDTSLRNPAKRNILTAGINTFIPLKVFIIPSLELHWIQEKEAQIRFEDHSLSSSVLTYQTDLAFLKRFNDQLKFMFILSAEHMPDKVRKLESIDYDYEYSMLGLLSYTF